MTTYSYETFPGQTIVRTAADGYTFEELLQELQQNGEGVIVIDEDRTDEQLEALAGITVAELKGGAA